MTPLAAITLFGGSFLAVALWAVAEIAEAIDRDPEA